MHHNFKHWWGHFRVHLRHTIQNGAIFYILAVIALMPVWFNPQMKLNSLVQDTLFVIDISESMNVSDVNYPEPKTDRFTLAKLAVRESMASLACGSRVAVSLFASDESVMLFEPLEVCRHFPAIDKMITGLDRRMRWIGDSLLTETVVLATQDAKDRNLNLVIITDGDEMPHKDIPYVNGLIKSRGQVKGLLLGVGGDALQAIPRFDERDEIIGYWSKEQAVLQGNYPDLLAYVRTLAPGEKAPEGMLDRVREHQSSYNDKVMKTISKAIAYELVRIHAPADAVSALNKTEYRKYAMAERDARWIYGLTATALVLIAWFWQCLHSSFIMKYLSVIFRLNR
ncbi:MAG: VWA domain-containing protein [Gammaproteobacteria bacterium]|nr:VWA domain-containing protein [Gammaproteobacteria bacterium]